MRSAPALLALLVLFAAAPHVAAEPCVGPREKTGTVCVTPSLTCPGVDYAPPWMDHYALARACVSGHVDASGASACHETIAGEWTRAGFRGVDEQHCVSVIQYADGTTCVSVSKREWRPIPVCLP